jgi:polar amino acid transport system substrate-binding protein
MKRLKKTDYIIISIILLLVIGIVLFIFGSNITKNSNSVQTTETETDVSYESFNGKRIGIRTGTSFEALTLEHFPDSEYSYFDTDSDLITALMSNKIDGFLDDEPVSAMIHIEHKEVDYMKSLLVDDDYYWGFNKDSDRSDKIRAEFNETLTNLRSSGELDNMKAKWMGEDESVKTYDKSGLTGENGTIMVAVVPDKVPFSYISNNEMTGYNIELLTIFCREHGYNYELEMTPVPGMLAGIQSGRYDIGAGTLSYTEERSQIINFSDVIYNGGVVMVARSEDLGTSGSASAPKYDLFNGKRIGIKTGSSFEPITLSFYPNAEYYYFDSSSDLITALKSDKIDCFLEDEPVAAVIHGEQPDVDYIRQPLMDDDYSFCFQKGTPRSLSLQGQFNEFLAKLKSNGKLDELKQKWTAGDASAKKCDSYDLTGENGNLMVVVLPDLVPFSYISDNKLEGLAVELTYLFAQEYGYDVTFEQATISAGIAGLTSGKYDILAGSISYTEERAQSIDYSDVFYNGGVVVIARTSDLNSEGNSSAEKTSFVESVKASFVKNFITESRYVLILQGIGTTCIITGLSVIFGSLLAFFICLFRRTDSILANKIANLYVKLLQGTPMVVLLMILYYVVFGKSGINAIWVAVIGFSLNFAAYTSEILRSGIESIDGGQREAALALGYSENQAFFKFIFPQASVRQIPVYRGEIISLMKNTSIVGYIAIQDLTKMSDIIRSRTYEAFFPLIATAIIYFILAWIIALVLNLILSKIDPKAKRAKAKEKEATEV